MQAAAQRCREAGGVELVWSVYASNALARRFYERLGARLFKDLDFMHLSVRGRR